MRTPHPWPPAVRVECRCLVHRPTHRGCWQRNPRRTIHHRHRQMSTNLSLSLGKNGSVVPILTRYFKSLAPERCSCILELVIFRLMPMIDILSIYFEIASQLIDDESKAIQVMAWCRQATSHYMNQCWPSSMWYGNTRPQWVKPVTVYVSSSGLISPLLATSPPECLDLQLDYWNVDSKLELGPREKLQKKDSKASLKTTFKCVRVYRLPQTPTTDLASAALAMVVITKEKKQKSRCPCMTPIALYFKVLGTFLQTNHHQESLEQYSPTLLNCTW